MRQRALIAVAVHARAEHQFPLSGRVYKPDFFDTVLSNGSSAHVLSVASNAVHQLSLSTE